MTYNELCRIADKRIKINQNTFPVDSYNIALSLGLRVKNSTEAKRDFANTGNPLLSCNGCLAIVNGEYTIYHDEKYAYKNFTISHEIAHYLLHHSCDGAEQHHDANLLASIIVAPKRLILTNGIESAAHLSTVCMIPAEVANEYWSELQFNHVISGKAPSVNDYLREIKSMFMDINKLLNNIQHINVGGATL